MMESMGASTKRMSKGDVVVWASTANFPPVASEEVEMRVMVDLRGALVVLIATLEESFLSAL